MNFTVKLGVSIRAYSLTKILDCLRPENNKIVLFSEFHMLSHPMWGLPYITLLTPVPVILISDNFQRHVKIVGRTLKRKTKKRRAQLLKLDTKIEFLSIR